MFNYDRITHIRCWIDSSSQLECMARLARFGALARATKNDVAPRISCRFASRLHISTSHSLAVRHIFCLTTFAHATKNVQRARSANARDSLSPGHQVAARMHLQRARNPLWKSMSGIQNHWSDRWSDICFACGFTGAICARRTHTRSTSESRAAIRWNNSAHL